MHVLQKEVAAAGTQDTPNLRKSTVRVCDRAKKQRRYDRIKRVIGKGDLGGVDLRHRGATGKRWIHLMGPFLHDGATIITIRENELMYAVGSIVYRVHSGSRPKLQDPAVRLRNELSPDLAQRRLLKGRHCQVKGCGRDPVPPDCLR